MTSLPSPTGKHLVGRLSFELKDEKRMEAYSSPSTSSLSLPEQINKRELVIWTWYPVSKPVSGSRAAEYMPDKWSGADFVYGVKLGTGNFECHSFENVPMAQSQSA